MPRWFVPWILPIVMVLVVMADAFGGGIGMVLLAICVLGVFAYLRRQQLLRDPPNPELVHKPFWRP